MPKVEKKIHILFTQEKPQEKYTPYLRLEKITNLQIDFCPFVTYQPITLGDFQYGLRKAKNFSSIIFVNKTTVDYFFSFCKKNKIIIPSSVKIFFITYQLSTYAQKYIDFKIKKNKILTAASFYDFCSLLTSAYQKEKFLIPGTKEHCHNIINFLKNYEMAYQEFSIYHVKQNDITHLLISKYQIIVFFNEKSVHCFQKHFSKYPPQHIKFATVGYQTAQAVKETNLPLVLQIPSKNNPSLVEGITEYCKAYRQSSV